MSYSTPQSNDSQLWAQHLEVLKERGIPAEYALAAGLRSIDLAQVSKAREAGTPLTQGLESLPLPPTTGIYIPYQVTTDGITRCRVRSDKTEVMLRGEPGTDHGDTVRKIPRYLVQKGISVIPYIPPAVAKSEVYRDTSVAVHIVEAPLKALALSAHGLLSIGLGGVLAGATDSETLKSIGEVHAHPELAKFDWGGRVVHIIFDAGGWDSGNQRANPQVALGMARVAEGLASLGAKVSLVQIPYTHVEAEDEGSFRSVRDQGPDDYLARHGVEEMKARIAEAVPYHPATWLAQRLAASASTEATGVVRGLLRNTTFQACLSVSGPIVQSEVAGLTKAWGAGKRDILDAASTFEDRVLARVQAEAPEWAKKLRRNAAGEPKATRENVFQALRECPELMGLVAYNEFADRIEFQRTPPWGDQFATSKSTVRGAPWTDQDDTRLGIYLSKTVGMGGLDSKVIQPVLDVVAREYAVHPLRDRLRALEWDGESRLVFWLQEYLRADAQEQKYHARIGTWWMVQAVARLEEPGCKADYALILEGDQGRRKSQAVKALAGCGYSDLELGDLENKEAVMSLQGTWIAEISEGKILRKAQADSIKAFISRQVDEYIPKHSNRKVKKARSCVFLLTINPQGEYLTDPTGARRFWPVRAGEIALEELQRDADQLWAEAYHYYRAGIGTDRSKGPWYQRWWPETQDELALTSGQQFERQEEHPWLPTIGKEIASIEHVTIPEILTCLGLPERDRKMGHSKEVSSILRQLGWTQAPSRTSGQRVWIRGPKAAPKATAVKPVSSEAEDAVTAHILDSMMN